MSKTRADIASDQSKLDFSVRLMEHLVVPTFVIDAHCRVIIWNRACERLTGIKAGEVLGTSEHWRGFYEEPRPCLADLIAQRRTDEIESLYAEHDRTGSESQLALGRRAENWCVMPCAGTRLYLAIDAGPIYDDAGQLVAVVETLRDITAQKVAQDELQRLATRDGLTGVANRRSFDTALNTECRRVSREARALSLLMIDVDYFKRYNDTYGHLAGDECLRQVAETMAQVTQRASDTVARYGGEEFAILLPATEPQGAVIVAERLRAAIEGLALPHAGSDVGPHVTVSIGVASIDPARAGPPTELIGAADAALYAAKMQGRNRVVQAGVGASSPTA